MKTETYTCDGCGSDCTDGYTEVAVRERGWPGWRNVTFVVHLCRDCVRAIYAEDLPFRDARARQKDWQNAAVMD